jgi:hypothetical protein
LTPSVFDANRSCASVTSVVTVAASGRCPVETKGLALSARTAIAHLRVYWRHSRYRAAPVRRKMDPDSRVDAAPRAHRSHVRGIVIDNRIAWTGGFGIDDKWCR